VIEPQLRGEPALMPELTLAEFVPLYLERHAAGVRPRTIATLRERLSHRRKLGHGETCRCATCAFGDVPLRDLERMSGEIASWQAKLPERWRHDIMQALGQTLEAAVRWGHMSCNPAKLAGRNPQPPPRAVRAYTHAELNALAAELSAMYRPLPKFASSTGLRPEEWGAVERHDVDCRERILSVHRTISSGKVVELAKTARSRRQVPLSRRALKALDMLTPRIDTPLLFSARAGGLVDLHNFRNREWAPAVEASGVRRPARIYDLRSTFASNALAAGVGVFELARVMGTSVQMIERHYGALLDGAGADTRDGSTHSTLTRSGRRTSAAKTFRPLSGQTGGPRLAPSRVQTGRFAGRRAGEPTEGFEPSTPALRERCSGQLSYVGVRGRV
jgi:integrase